MWIPKGDKNDPGQKLVWSTKNVNDLLVALDKGYRPQVSMPFYEGKQFLRKGNIVFEYTEEEIAELAKCANDIVYFAEKYAVVMTICVPNRMGMRAGATVIPCPCSSARRCWRCWRIALVPMASGTPASAGPEPFPVRVCVRPSAQPQSRLFLLCN